MKNNNYQSRKAIQLKLSALRRKLGQLSFRCFANTYLSGYFKHPPSEMHEEMFDLLEKATLRRNARLAIAAPRCHAKSTLISQAYVLWCICYGLENYIVLISDTAEQAIDHLSAVKKELESNPLLLEDFRDVAEAPGVKPGPERWRKNDIISKNGIKVLALGAGQKIRGRKHRQHRPSLIVLDDVENQKEVISQEQREYKMEWFKKSVMKAGVISMTNVVVAGTVLHYDSLLANLLDCTKMPGWTSRKYKAVISWANRDDLWQLWTKIYTNQESHDGRTGPEAAKDYFEANQEQMLAGSKVLWPEGESYYQLMELRLCDGQGSFDSEKQNEPLDPAQCYFNMENATYWDDQYRSVDELLAKLGGNSEIFGACDPSLGLAGKNHDDTAIITILKHEPTGHMYVLDADISRRKPHETITAIYNYFRERKYARFGLETNQFQHFMASELRRFMTKSGMYGKITDIKHTSDKLGRIQSLESLVATGQLRFSRKHSKLIEQLRHFPKASHDDGPDALEMAVKLANEPVIIFFREQY